MAFVEQLFDRLPVLILAGLLSWLTSGCASTQEASLSASHIPSVTSSDNELVFIVHGDGNYLYHDQDGKAVYADEGALDKILGLATTLSNTEVFVFHQQKRRRRFFFFHKQEGMFYHFKNGRQILEQAYRQDLTRPWMEVEQDMYDARIAAMPAYTQRAKTSLLLYFGHEIPEQPVKGYHRSFPQVDFSISDVSERLSVWRKNNEPGLPAFDAVVLSTCNNGSPYVVDALAPHTSYLMASPTNLHLSYFDIDFLRTLEQQSPIVNMEAFLQSWAETSYMSLIKRVQTVVSVSVYDVKATNDFVKDIMPAYRARIESQQLKGEMQKRNDCLKDPELLNGLNDDYLRRGQEVYVRYRPARFGRQKHLASHSGWSCVSAGNTLDKPG